MKLVGKEGQRIETPPATAFTMAGEGATKAQTLARQTSKEDGAKLTRVSDEELRKMGLDPGVVDGARRELAEVAGVKGWKLEVFEVGDGARELRGVVEGDEEEEEEEEGGGGDGEGEGDEAELDPYDQGEDGGGSEEVFRDEL